MKDALKSEKTHEAPNPDWSGIAQGKAFRNLVAVKTNFIVPAFVFFLIYFLGFVALVGYAPKLVSIRVIGTVNIAYLLALSQFVVGWVIAALYLAVADKFDRLAADILARMLEQQGDR